MQPWFSSVLTVSVKDMLFIADTWQFHTKTKNSKGDWIIFGDMYLKKFKG